VRQLLPVPAAVAISVLQAELQRRLDAEHKRAHLDMRHRLDKDGNRYGKILDYK
jgi:hypothetical protein